MRKQMARPLAWLPDDRYVEEGDVGPMTKRELLLLILGSVIVAAVLAGVAFAFGALA